MKFFPVGLWLDQDTNKIPIFRDCDLITAGELFGRSGYGVGLQKGSPWADKITLAILDYHESKFPPRDAALCILTQYMQISHSKLSYSRRAYSNIYIDSGDPIKIIELDEILLNQNSYLSRWFNGGFGQ